MRIAYIILGHRLANQIARLVHTLGDADDSFFIHWDRKAGVELSHQLAAQLRTDARVHLLPRHRVYWGAFSVVEATIEGIEALFRTGAAFDRAVLLSGQDYPIKSRSHIKAFFARHPEREYMESFPLLAPNRWSDLRDAGHGTARALRWHLHFRGRWLHTPIRRAFPGTMQPYGGAQWWCLSRSCLEYIHRFISHNRQFVNYFKRAYIPDEMFFQTIVSNSPFGARVTGSDLTFVDWSRPKPPFPAVLDKSYLPVLLGSPKLFARKFDGRHDPEILDLIDELIIDSGPICHKRPAANSPA
jgi:Core-2/I-Branching enzyme